MWSMRCAVASKVGARERSHHSAHLAHLALSKAPMRVSLSTRPALPALALGYIAVLGTPGRRWHPSRRAALDAKRSAWRARGSTMAVSGLTKLPRSMV